MQLTKGRAEKLKSDVYTSRDSRIFSMRIVQIIVAIIIIAASIFLASFLLKDDDLNSAIYMLEDEKYIDSLELLNRLATVCDYDAGEKIFYYRSRAINRLALYLESEYEEELNVLFTGDINSIKKKKIEFSIKKELDAINNKIEGDLILMICKDRCRIISQGKFYDDFISVYRGSRFIEDLDFEELKKIERTEIEKIPNAISNFYTKYPDTNYIPKIIKIFFSCLKRGNITVKGREKLFNNLIWDFGRRYPTSSEFQRVFICNGASVNLRNSPGLNGDVIGKVKRDEILIQLEKSMDLSQIGDVRAFWYRMANLQGIQGWIFGKFLVPMDVTRFRRDDNKDSWTLEESFVDWIDSNTPQNWMHIGNSEKNSIGFHVRGDCSVIELNSKKGKSAGLFRRFISPRSFSLLARARFIAGDVVTVFAYVLNKGRVYYLRVSNDQIDIAGRRIPLYTTDWHDYLLESSDGRFARLSIDGEVISSRIPSVRSKVFRLRGLYCLYSSRDEISMAEMDYIKVKQ